MAGVEGGEDVVEQGRVYCAAGHLHGAFVDLPQVAHFHAALNHDVAIGKAVGQQALAAFLLQPRQGGVEAAQVGIVLHQHGFGGQIGVFNIGNNLPESAQAGSEFGHQYFGDAHFFGQRNDVHPGGTTGANQGKIARVVALLDGDAANAVGHVLVDDGADAVGGVGQINAQRCGNMGFDGSIRTRGIKGNALAEHGIGLQVAQCHIGIGNRGQLTAFAVAGGAGIGAGAVRAYFEHTEGVDVGDGATARAQGFHMNHGHADAVAQEVNVAVEAGLAAFGQGDVKRGAAHVDGNHVVDAERRGDKQAGLRSGGGAGINGVYRALSHHFAHGQAAVGLEIAHRLHGA